MVIVPIRGLTGSKSRLAPMFDAEERMELVWAMADRVLAAMPAWVHPVVITKSVDSVRQRLTDVRIVEQHATPTGLNGALTQGHWLANAEGARDVLMISADLPLVTAAEVELMLHEDGSIVIAGDTTQRGTNGIRLPSSLAGRFRFHMGTESWGAHVAESRALGISPITVYESGLARDLDTPEDWSVLPVTTRDTLLERIQCGTSGVSM